MNGSLSAAGFIAFIAAFSQITRPVRAFIDQFANINQGVAAGERIFAVLDAKNEINDAPDAKDFEGFKDKVEFRDVHFTACRLRCVRVRQLRWLVRREVESRR